MTTDSLQIGDVVRISPTAHLSSRVDGQLAIIQNINYNDRYPIKLILFNGHYVPCLMSEVELVEPP